MSERTEEQSSVDKNGVEPDKLKQDFAKATAIPTARNGLERKNGTAVSNFLAMGR